MELKYRMNILEIDGRKIAVPQDSSDSFRGVLQMNDTTDRILQLLSESTTEDAIISCLLGEYNASEERIRQSVRKVLDILRLNDLLVE